MEKKKIFLILFILTAIGTFFSWYTVMNKKMFGLGSKTVSILQIASETEGQSTRPVEAENLVSQDSAQQGVEVGGVPQDAPAVIDGSKNSPELKEKAVLQNSDKSMKKTDSEEKVGIKSDSGKIVQKLMSNGFQKSSDRKIDTIIVHSSYDALGSDPYDVDGIIDEYKQYGVSAHYLIARDGVIYQLVLDQNIAWHAGVSKMPDGRTDVNEFSIGVEMINTKDGKYTDEQYDALNSLIALFKKQYPIKNIFGHNEIAPERKTDPWNISWGKVQK